MAARSFVVTTARRKRASSRRSSSQNQATGPTVSTLYKPAANFRQRRSQMTSTTMMEPDSNNNNNNRRRRRQRRQRPNTCRDCLQFSSSMCLHVALFWMLQSSSSSRTTVVEGFTVPSTIIGIWPVLSVSRGDVSLWATTPTTTTTTTQQPPSSSPSDNDTDSIETTGLKSHPHRRHRDPASRFHSDMKRVLESRRNQMLLLDDDEASFFNSQQQQQQQQQSSGSTMMMVDRKQRPPILSQDLDGAVRVQSMLRHMVEIGVATETSFQIVMEAIVNRGRSRWFGRHPNDDDYPSSNGSKRNNDSGIVCAADEMEHLMKELWQRQGGKVLTETCNLALKAYATCSTPRGDRQYAQKAQSLLDDMIDNDIPVAVESYGHVIHAWAWQQENRQEGVCARMAHENLERLLEMTTTTTTTTHTTDDDDDDNDTMILLQSSHAWVLEAWSKSSSKEAPELAEKILREMERLGTKENRTLTATTTTTPHDNNQHDGPPHNNNNNNNSSSSSSSSIIFPDSQSYANAILAWTKSCAPKAASRAQVLLTEQLERYEAGIAHGGEPELIAFNGVIAAWSRAGRSDLAEKVLWKAVEMETSSHTFRPDILSFNSVVNAYLFDRDQKRSLRKILNIVEYMQKSDREELQPNLFTWRCVLKAWAKTMGTPEAANHAINTIQKMHALWEAGDTSMEPSNAYYNMAINTIAKTRGVGGGAGTVVDARKALEMFHLLQSSQHCSPDIISYTSVIECFAKSDDSEAAEVSLQLFEEVDRIYDETQADDMMPNHRTYTLTIQALSKTPVIANVIRARELLSQLVERYETTKDDKIRPNVYPYNYVLNCASFCVGDDKDKLQAFKVATATYNDMRTSDYTNPDSYTYSFWFKCCNNLLPHGELRTKCVSFAFHQCQRDGLVSAETLKRLLAGTPRDVLVTLLGIDPNASPAKYRSMSLKDLPPAWSRNVEIR